MSRSTRSLPVVAGAGLVAIALASCGGTATTVVKTAPPVTVTTKVIKTKTVSPTTSQASSASCPNPSIPAPIHELVATGVDCSAASGVAGAWASAGTNCQTGTCSAAGFSCASSQPSPSAEFLSVKCVSGNEAVTFDSGG
jgi:hypothetical protein